MSVLVVGGGFAGWAACWELLRQGIEVQWLFDNSGASGLYSGALDYRLWSDSEERPSGEVGAHSEGPDRGLAWLRDQERWLSCGDGQSPQRVVSSAGVVRPAFARDKAVLDLQSVAGQRLAVVDLKRPGWSAPWLARSVAESDWARGVQLQVESVDALLPDPAAAKYLGDADLCGVFDQPDVRRAVAERLAEVGGRFDGFLFGPWLGGAAATSLSAALKRPVGETLSEPGQGAGLRYEREREQWARGADLAVFRGRLCRLEPASDAHWLAHATPLGRPEASVLGPFEGAVLCTGGVVAGGIEFRPGALGLQRFVPGYQAPVEVGVSDSNAESPLGQQRSDLVALGLPALERAGLLSPPLSVPGRPPLAVAGDALAGRARTALLAVESGLAAAVAAAERLRPAVSLPV